MRTQWRLTTALLLVFTVTGCASPTVPREDSDSEEFVQDQTLDFNNGSSQNNNQNNNKPKLYHGVIRSAFIQWVKSNKFSKEILSFEQASIDHGGDGAFYIYLRKKKN